MTPRRHATIHVKDVPVDKVTRWRGEEDDGAFKLFDITPAAGRRALFEPGGELGVLHQRLCEFSVEIARPKAVDLDAVFRQLNTHALVSILSAPLTRYRARYWRDRARH